MTNNAKQTPCAIRSKKMVNNKITIFRLVILGLFFLLFTFGGHFIGSNLNLILPIFNCEYVGCGLLVVYVEFVLSGL